MLSWSGGLPGPCDAVQDEDVDSPVVKDDELLVRVHAASLNQGDLDYLYGKPFSLAWASGLLRAARKRGLGLDAAGHVEAVEDSTRFQPGDAVLGYLTQFGH